METTHGKTHSENGEGEGWWSRIETLFCETFLCVCVDRKLFTTLCARGVSFNLIFTPPL